MTTCAKCQNEFDGESWQRFCRSCYDTVKSVTTPAAESQHPALIYERTHEREAVVKGDPAHAAREVEAMRSMLAPFIGGAVEPYRAPTQWSCQHDMKRVEFCDAMCVKCGLYSHQLTDQAAHAAKWGRPNGGDDSRAAPNQ